MDKEKIIKSFNEDMLIKKHAYIKIKEQGFSIFEIEDAILSDDIIEEYPDDFPLYSILILGYTKTGIPLHIVCAPTEKNLIIITVYKPDPAK